uniref:Si:busm1-194e12.8 n=1 Tax=Nothobranchius furzeri TaxID=105023 RepID=A0A8C6LMQ6_NOTFU
MVRGRESRWSEAEKTIQAGSRYVGWLRNRNEVRISGTGRGWSAGEFTGLTEGNGLDMISYLKGKPPHACSLFTCLNPSPDPPSSLIIYPRDDVEPGQENVLLCQTSGFYPAPVNLSWTKNNREVTEGTSINVPYPNKDGSFTQISRLVFIPKLGDIYSCTVEHVALEEPLTRTWDVQEDDPQPGIGPAVFCAVGLIIGLFGVAIGTFFLIKGNECS